MFWKIISFHSRYVGKNPSSVCCAVCKKQLKLGRIWFYIEIASLANSNHMPLISKGNFDTKLFKCIIDWETHLFNPNCMHANIVELSYPANIFRCFKRMLKLKSLILNYIKQLRLKDALYWTPLFSKEKLHTREYD